MASSLSLEVLVVAFFLLKTGISDVAANSCDSSSETSSDGNFARNETQ